MSSSEVSKRQIKIVNVDVGFLQPVSNRRTHRGTAHGIDASTKRPVARNITRGLPSHLKAVYAPALQANIDADANTMARKTLSSAHDLAEKLLHVVLAKKASKIPDRTSVGTGGKACVWLNFTK